MEPIHTLFLQAVKAALLAQPVQWEDDVTPDDLIQVLELSLDHHILPLVFEATYTCPAAKALEPGLFQKYRSLCVQRVMAQAVKTEDFLELYAQWRQDGLRPLVVKGLICRQLYPMPDCRFSGDEDVFSGEEAFKPCRETMLRMGLEPCDAGENSYEIPFRRPDSPLYIELHKALFAEDSDIFSQFNQLFEGAVERAVEVPINGVAVATLCPTDHMLYLIIHAFKHFLYSGFGIRQICDMVIFANAYGEQIHWEVVRTKCAAIRADTFAGVLFTIGRQYLTLSPERSHCPEAWLHCPADPQPLLDDLLRGGIYGSADRSRLHSGNMTLHAVEADKNGRHSGGNPLKALFPSAKSLQGRYPWLRRRPFLLPVAWASRLFTFARDSMAGEDGGAAEIIRIGSQRIALLRQYHIID